VKFAAKKIKDFQISILGKAKNKGKNNANINEDIVRKKKKKDWKKIKINKNNLKNNL